MGDTRPEPAAVPMRFWRSVAEARGELESAAHTVDAPGSRRDFMRLMGASLALAGLGGCSRPPLEKIVPFRDGPAQQSYAEPLFYASALPRDAYALGVLVECNMGRPTKIEGNPLHPASLGATDVFAQADVLELWNPDRSQSVRAGGTIATWAEFVATLRQRLRALRGGVGVRLLTETVTSPSLHAQIRSLLERLPEARWHQWQPLNRDNAYAGATLAYGAPVETVYRFDRARTVLALDADFLDGMPGCVRYARDFAATRAAHAPQERRSRLYALECTPTLTGAAADHRLPMRARDIGAAAHALAHALGAARSAPAQSPVPADWLRMLGEELRQSRGESIVVAGERQPAWVHALAHAMNEALGNVGSTVAHLQPVAAEPVDHLASIGELARDMQAGQVDTLLILDANPVYTAPADVGFAEALGRVPLKVHLGLYEGETGARCDWHLPAAHALESWGDLRAFDGTCSLQQPCIAPLYDGHCASELIAIAGGDVEADPRALLRAYWQRGQPGDFDAFFDDALRRGVVPGSAPPPKRPSLRGDVDAQVAKGATSSAGGDLELVLTPDSRTGDGRYADNAWLQELPKPLTQLTWDNAALIAPALAQRLGLRNGDVVELHAGARNLHAPVWITPGMPEASVSLSLGYGRTHAGTVGRNRGVDAYSLRPSSAPWFQAGLSIRSTGRRHSLVSAQTHGRMEGRDIVRIVSAAQAAACTAAACGTPDYRSQRSLYESPPMGPYAWAMSIDLSSCIGCGACTIACQAENNIPVVGKEEVGRGREMHWIRVDRYHEGSVDNPRTVFQPVPCMQCEHAPCEVVCPVEASVHDAQGINVQVYNRCVGTRFCSNNCPYKVRRFNFLQYAKDEPSLDAQRNPEVSVRMRGVMEKCNYCLQRVTTARIAADREGRVLRDGEVVTACQAACPSRAIVFGDLNVPDSEVNRRKRSPLDYALLAELNTRPRTTYLARVTNPRHGL
ncbi:MAG TPA: 4Fe-4S dicluster domain-containing protein [Casimicrobiaceae bacterium]